MSIVIDANCLASVFRSDDPDFLPVKKWIDGGAGKMVIGGTKYLCEIGKVAYVLQIVQELKKQNKVHSADKNSVDVLENYIDSITSHKCNDSHLIALLGVTKCPLICTKDSSADVYLKEVTLYPWSGYMPKIYRSAKQVKALLTREHASVKLLVCKEQNSNFDSFIRGQQL